MDKLFISVPFLHYSFVVLSLLAMLLTVFNVSISLKQGCHWTNFLYAASWVALGLICGLLGGEIAHLEIVTWSRTLTVLGIDAVMFMRVLVSARLFGGFKNIMAAQSGRGTAGFAQADRGG